ncbi:conserved hypothetical protein [Thermobaculum terrenum ATCC BAA-798]|uniref:Beta-galactosidase trimerisation domain-containing protein n=1 Tax=Thermobaculum terrenum (strain ATCC BAA-798 / CCMEE 7001 / YNP1) TaxID=525904 RepID=D1CHJ6_THET1|nr:alpha-amylase family protein [Thermobaculum terrenum]ACZ43217.1 conserved hypothetical protein [Thermobaculum terrenum ATCC BAA-798]
MGNLDLPYRQIHLDFHTSAACEDVGRDFDPEEFVRTLKMGQVESITIFGKCHHGFSYYPTQLGTQHPNLSFDLMGEQLRALHGAGIRAPIYVSIMWDDLAGEQHPEWVVVDREGRMVMRPPLTNYSPLEGKTGWTTLDVSSGYGDYVVSQIAEICDRYPVDGFFFDICFPLPNYSPWGQARMRAAGVDLADERAVSRYAWDRLCEFFERVSSLVRAKAPDSTIFYNGTVSPHLAKVLGYQTHVEIESLPTSGLWGYLHYPIAARHARALGAQFVGMTGRFHKAWADFGGLKTRNQLDYECGVIVSAGGRISVGDQLHPNGRLDPAVYRLLGHAFGRIAALESWLRGARPTAEVGVLAGPDSQAPMRYSPGTEGAAQMLLEAGIQFDLVDHEAVDITSYRVILLPEDVSVGRELEAKLQLYLEKGGHCITAAPQRLSFLPVESLEPSPTTPSYFRVPTALVGGSELATDYDYVFYDTAYVVRPRQGAYYDGDLRRALFNRTWEHFTSHAHAPVGESLSAPLIVMADQLSYIALPIFGAYHRHDYWAYRAVAVNALLRHLPDPVVRYAGPGWVEVSVHEQELAGLERKIVHLVTYTPRRTSHPIPHVDSGGQVVGISLGVRNDGRTPSRVYLAPDGAELGFTVEGGYTQVQLPGVGPHTVIVLEY